MLFRSSTLTISDGGPQLLDYGTVNGLTVVIEDAYGTVPGGSTDTNTFDTNLFHHSTDAYSDPITTNSPHSDDQLHLEIGGSANKWGNDWTTSDVQNIQIRLNNPVEPAGGASIGLIGTYVYLIVNYTVEAAAVPPSSVNFASGVVNFPQGNITI